MRITFEESGKLSLIYLYLRPFDGIIVDTWPSVRANLLLDTDNNWVGVEVLNDLFEDGKFDLPALNDLYMPINSEVVTLSNDGYLILFGANLTVNSKIEVACNIDYNDVNGLQGIEFTLVDFNSGLEHIKNFT